MSDLVFPFLPTQLPGVMIGCERTPVFGTGVAAANDGTELRASWQSYPRYKYSVQLEFLRSSVTYAEFQRVMSAFGQAAGQYDSFLLQDPDDYQVTQHGFAVCDGSSTLYQLQRTLGGLRQSGLYDPAPYPVSTTPRTNLVAYSQDASHWSSVHGGAGVAPTITPAYALGPDGTLTAGRVQLSTGAGTTSADYSGASIALATAWAAGSPVTLSVWARTNDGSTVAVAPVASSLGGTLSVGPTWQRISKTWTPAASEGVVNLELIGLASDGTSQTADLLLWGAQVEQASAASAYIAATTDAATTVKPAYWPTAGDGFEPVTEVNTATLAVYDNGTPATGWTYESGGGVLFTAPPANGHVLTWSGQYFRRVRFASDSLPLARIFASMWAAKTVDFISVK